MPLDERDKSLLQRFLAATADLSPERASDEAGLGSMAVRRWRDALPSRLTTENRRKLINYLAGIRDVSRETATRERVTLREELPIDESFIDDLLDTIQKAADSERDPEVRRQGGTPATRQLLASLYAVGVRARWPKNWMAKLDAARDSLDAGQ